MDLTLTRFNRIIDLTFYTAGGLKKKEIRCPRHGRKPTIEINGTFTDRGFLPTFNITVTNLYLELQSEQYETIEVTAGYATGGKTNTAKFKGSILTIYPEAPGPDGKTVIQCQWGKLQDWLDATVDVNYEAGTPLKKILEEFKIRLALEQTQLGLKKAIGLTTKQQFMHNGTVRDAIDKLERMFEQEKLVIFIREDTLFADCLEDDFTDTKFMQYLSAPPQPNTGGSRGTFYTTVTGPWMPELHLFDLLIIPSRVYMKNFGMVGTGKTQTIRVSALSFHFGTTGGTNQMTVQGTLA